MRDLVKLLSLAAVIPMLSITGCSGGCDAPPEKEKEQSGGGGGGGAPSNSSRGSDIVISDKGGKRVPKPYQRKGTATDAAKPSAGGPEAGSASTAAAAGFGKPGLPVARVIRRRVDGISNRVEVKCRVMAMSSDGECSSASNYAEIKERCCPGGTIERCKVGMRGVVLIGLDCEKPQ